MLYQLAIETSVREYSVCLSNGDETLTNTNESSSARASTGLLPEIQGLLETAKCQPADIDAIGVSIGPGSFTGLRMGVSTAKTLAWALDCEIYCFSTHKIIAYQAAMAMAATGHTAPKKIVSLIDAQRGQWFAQAFTSKINDLPESDGPATIVEPAEYLAGLSEPHLICGPALQRWREKIEFPNNSQVVASQYWMPQAKTISAIMRQYKTSMQPVNAMQLVPTYGRKSAAEEKWLAGKIK